jgi:hypothetical protein
VQVVADDCELQPCGGALRLHLSLDAGNAGIVDLLQCGRAEGLDEKVQRLKQMAKDAGKPEPSISIFGSPARPEAIEGYEKLGVDRIIFGLPPAPAETVLPVLERRAELGDPLAHDPHLLVGVGRQRQHDRVEPPP